MSDSDEMRLPLMKLDPSLPKWREAGTLEIRPEDTVRFQIYRAQILNVHTGADQWRNMADAATAAFRKMKQAGEENFKVNVTSNSGPNLQQIAEKAFRHFVAIAVDCVQRKVPVAELSEEQKFAICVAARVQLKTGDSGALVLKLETRNLCGIVWDDEEGEYRVYEREQ